MRFLAVLTTAEDNAVPPRALTDAIDRMVREAGPIMVETGGLAPSATGARIGIRNGRVTVTDGPFVESKEVIGGYAIVEVPSRQEALAWAERFIRLHQEHWPGWEGTVELRQIQVPEDVPDLQ